MGLSDDAFVGGGLGLDIDTSAAEDYIYTTRDLAGTSLYYPGTARHCQSEQLRECSTSARSMHPTCEY